MGIRQSCKIGDLKEELRKEKIAHEVTKRQLKAISRGNTQRGTYITKLQGVIKAAGLGEVDIDDESIPKAKKKREIDDLRTRIEQLECSHKTKKVILAKVELIDFKTDTFYDEERAYEECCYCGKRLRRLDMKEYHKLEIKKHEETIENLKSKIDEEEE